MKSKEMFKVLLDRFADVAYSAGIVETEARAEVADAKDCADESFVAGVDSRDDEVAELKDTVNQLVRDVANQLDRNHDLESKLREKELDSYNAGVQNGRESAVTKATIKIMSDAAARTIFAGERWR